MRCAEGTRDPALERSVRRRLISVARSGTLLRNERETPEERVTRAHRFPLAVKGSDRVGSPIDQVLVSLGLGQVHVVAVVRAQNQSPRVAPRGPR